MAGISQIRNFCIIAHIDHGKSTLADRFLELTSAVEKRKMREQFLDQMELERERGITIKMQPVRMLWHPQSQISPQNQKQVSVRDKNLKSQNYILNLIDTPGHIDFSYEVSRSLQAVEGAVLLVDATQGVQAQTMSSLETAESLGLVIIPVINKVDSYYARTKETKNEIIEILGCSEKDILSVSAKTGQNCAALLREVVQRVPSPIVRSSTSNNFRALVFDFEYSLHKGVILYIRVVDGEIKKGDSVFLFQAKSSFSVGEVGVFTPSPQPSLVLKSGEIGYVVTNIKEANIAHVGDTLLFKNSASLPLEGYKQPAPVVWASIYSESQPARRSGGDDFLSLKQSLERLKLSDSALFFEQEESGILGRGFRCGFLGMLHLEIVTERLKREFNLRLVTAMPSVAYKIEDNSGGQKEIYSPALFPEPSSVKRILEPWVEIKIITPFGKLSEIIGLFKKHDTALDSTEDFSQSRLLIKAQMPLREMMNNFFEELKSVTAGYASLSYSVIEMRKADLVRLDVLLNEEIMPAFSRIVSRPEAQKEARKTAEKLQKFLPRALFVIKIQVKALNRILASRSISALKKNVTGNLYGGDVTRKMKLWKKQKKGKEKLKKHGKVNVPQDVFLKMIQNKE